MELGKFCLFKAKIDAKVSIKFAKEMRYEKDAYFRRVFTRKFCNSIQILKNLKETKRQLNKSLQENILPFTF